MAIKRNIKTSIDCMPSKRTTIAPQSRSNLSLSIGSGGEDLAFSGWNGGVAADQLGEDTPFVSVVRL